MLVEDAMKMLYLLGVFYWEGDLEMCTIVQPTCVLLTASVARSNKSSLTTEISPASNSAASSVMSARRADRSSGSLTCKCKVFRLYSHLL